MQFVVSVNQFLKEHSFLSAFVAICTGLMIMWQLITVAVSAEVETKVASVREQVIKNTKDIRTVQRDIGEIKFEWQVYRRSIRYQEDPLLHREYGSARSPHFRYHI